MPQSPVTAIRNAAITAATIAASYALDIPWLLVSGHDLLGAVPANVSETVALDAGITALTVAITLWLWRSPSRVAAAALLLLCAIQATYALTEAAWFSAAVWVWAAIYAFSAVRATFGNTEPTPAEEAAL